MLPQGITAPDSVPEGSDGPIEVHAPGATKITVNVSTTGDTLTVPVDCDGTATFELPATALAGAILTIIDDDNPSDSTTIVVTPASL